MPGQPVTGSGWVLGGRYRVIERIGVGGMAEVFRAHDELLARDVAVKVFRAHPVTPDTASGGQRQEIELRALARLNHPNLITLFDGSITGTDGPAFLVLELINGPTLATRISDAPLPEPEATEVGIQIADALAYVHAQGMVHRDVKPANILLGTDRTAGDSTVRARLSDFGIVRLLGSERLTSADFTLGTASYLAPEQARGSDVGPVADVYSLGLVLIEALTGVRSFDGPPLEAMLARLSRDPDVPGHLSPPWPALLAAMTAGNPAARPTAAQVAQTLRDARSGSAPVALATGAAEAETVGLAAARPQAAATSAAITDAGQPIDQSPRRRRPAWLLAAAAVVAALAVAGVLLLRPTSNPERAPSAPGSATRSVSPGTHSSPAAGSVASPTATPTHSSPAHRSSAAATTTAAPTTSTPPSTSADSTSAPATSSASASSAAAASGTPSSSPVNP